MNKVSEAILALKPVTFHYKSDNTNTSQFGLIAEEVQEVNSDLVVRDKEGKPYSALRPSERHVAQRISQRTP